MFEGIRIGFVPLAGWCATAAGAGACTPAVGADLAETGVSRLSTAVESRVYAAAVGVSSCAGLAVIIHSAVRAGAIAPTVARGDGVTVGSPIKTWAVGTVVGTAAADVSVSRLSVAA